MAKYKVAAPEPMSNGDLHTLTEVYVEKPDGEGGTIDTMVGHFTIVLKAADVLALAGLGKAERIAGYKALFFADRRIQDTKLSEAAADQMRADVPFPTTVSF